MCNIYTPTLEETLCEMEHAKGSPLTDNEVEQLTIHYYKLRMEEFLEECEENTLEDLSLN